MVGSIQTRSWEDQSGGKRYATDVVADEVNFVDSKSEAAPTGQSGAYTQEQANFEALAENDDLPF